MRLNRTTYKFLAFIVALGLLLLILSPILVRAQTNDSQSAAMLLNRYGLVEGDERGFRLRDDITRAEMAKLLVLSLGLGAQVGEHAGRNVFPDTVGHWADGHIALARRMGIMKGYPEGVFRPQAKVSYAELLTVLSRLVGFEPGPDPWPYTYLEPARRGGIVPATMTDLPLKLDAAAIRGDVFIMLKRTLADVKNYAGKTLLQTYLDKTPPRLVIDPQPEQTQYASITVTGTAGDAVRVTVNGSEVPLAHGVFESTVDLRLGPNTVRVLAFDEADNMAEQTARVTRVPGTVARIEFTGPQTVAVGQKAQYRIVLRDANGVEVSDQKLIQAQVVPALGQFDSLNGTFTAGTTAGATTITILAGGAQASLSVAVTAGGLDRIVVTPDQVTLGPGETATFSALGYDAQGNPVPVPDLTWSAGAGTMNAGGTFTAPVTSAAITVTASAGGKTATAKIYPQNYKVATVQLTQPAGTLRANGKTQASVTATVRDDKGQPVTDYVGRLQVTSSAPETLQPLNGSVEVVDGVATIPLQVGTRPGTATLTATTNLGKKGTLAVSVSAQALQSIRISGLSRPTFDGTTLADIEAVALDQDGNNLVSAMSQAVVLRLALSPDGWGTFVSTGQSTADIAMGALDPATGDVRSRAVVRYIATSGTLYITGSVRPESFAYVTVLPGALATGQVGAPARITMEAIAQAAAGGVQQVSVNVLDANGFRVTNTALLTTVSLTLRDQNGAVWNPTTPLTSPANPGRAVFDVVQTRVGTYTYTATMYPNGAAASGTGRVVAGVPSTIALSASPQHIQADSTGKAVLRAEIHDAFGNLVEPGSYQVVFARNPGAAVTDTPTTLTKATVAGVAEISLAANQVVGTESWSASVATPVLTSATSAEITASGAPRHFRLTYGATNSNLAGLPQTIIAEVMYQQPSGATGVATQDNGRQVTLTLRNTTTGQEFSYTGTTKAGKVEFTVTRPEAIRFAVKAESGALIKALSVGYGGGSPADLVLAPNGTTGLRVATDLSQLRAGNANSFALVSVQILDANGNVTTNQSGLPLSVTLTASTSCTDCGTFTLDDGAVTASNRTTKRTVVIAPGASTSPAVRFYSGVNAGTTAITASTIDGRTSSTNISSVTSIGAASQLKVEPIPAQAVEPHTYADAAVTGQIVTVTVLDANGNRVTDFSDTLTVTTAADTRVVAQYDQQLALWVTRDTVPGNGLGDTDYLAPAQIRFSRGQAIFAVRANMPGIKVYTLSAGGVGGSVSVQGTFSGVSPEYLSVQADRRRVTGGGSQIAIQARVRDLHGNTLPYITGTVNFEISIGGVTWGLTTAAGNLLANSATLQSGVATVYFQSAQNVTGPDPTVAVRAWAPGLKRNDGSDLSAGSSTAAPAGDSFVVDATPFATGIQAVSTTPGVGTGDQIRMTFSELLDPASIHPSLSAGVLGVGPPYPGAATVQFDAAASSVSFVGLPWQGTINMAPGAIMNPGNVQVASYAVASLEYEDNLGQTTVIIILGDKQGGGDPTMVNWSGTARVSMNGLLRDTQGSSAIGPFLTVPLSGGF